jgi:hypothetical protein
MNSYYTLKILFNPVDIEMSKRRPMNTTLKYVHPEMIAPKLAYKLSGTLQLPLFYTNSRDIQLPTQGKPVACSLT